MLSSTPVLSASPEPPLKYLKKKKPIGLIHLFATPISHMKTWNWDGEGGLQKCL